MDFLKSVQHSFRTAALALVTVLGANHAAAQCEPELEAYIAVDAHTGDILMEKESDTKIQPASMTKMMTLLLAQEAMDEGLMSPDDRLYIARGTYLRSDMERFSGWSSPVRLSDAMQGAAIRSYNDLAATIAEYTAKAYGEGNTETDFVALMNRKAEEIGMENTEFYNSSGLPNRLIRTREAGTTTKDMATLLKYIHDNHPALSELLGTAEARVRRRTLRTTNTLMRNDTIPDQDIYGKTGFTCDAGFSLTAGTRRGENGVIVSYVGGEGVLDREVAIIDILNEAYGIIEEREIARQMELDTIINTRNEHFQFDENHVEGCDELHPPFMTCIR